MTDAASLEQLRPIYEESFAPSQREPWQQMLDAIASGRTQMRGTWVGDSAAGLALSHLLPKSRCAYVSHLAIASKWRGRGIADPLHALDAVFMDHYAPGGLVLEIDDPDLATDPVVVKHARQLQNLYERWGAIVVCASGYQMPDLVEPEVLMPMRLMWFPGSQPHSYMRGEVLTELATELWEYIYGAPVGDPRTARVLTAMAAADGVLSA